MDLYPLNGALLLLRFFQLFDLDCLLLQDRVAVHADTGGRDSSVTARPCGGVAIETGNFVVTGMHFVGKSDRLLRRIPLMNADARELICSSAARNDHTHDPHQYQ